eukprot:791356-Prymnesium_polylepis.1
MHAIVHVPIRDAERTACSLIRARSDGPVEGRGGLAPLSHACDQNGSCGAETYCERLGREQQPPATDEGQREPRSQS